MPKPSQRPTPIPLSRWLILAPCLNLIVFWIVEQLQQGRCRSHTNRLQPGLYASSEQADTITFPDSWNTTSLLSLTFYVLEFFFFFSGKIDVFSCYPNFWSKTWKLARVHLLDCAFFILVTLKISLDHLASVEKEAFKNSTFLLTTSIPMTNFILQSLWCRGLADQEPQWAYGTLLVLLAWHLIARQVISIFSTEVKTQSFYPHQHA